MELESQGTEPNQEAHGKRPYQTPQLSMYGNIREVTKNLGPKGVDDNGGGAGAGPKTGQ